MTYVSYLAIENFFEWDIAQNAKRELFHQVSCKSSRAYSMSI